MSENAYVYFIFDEQGRIGYVGIGGRSRPYGPHTPEVDALRDRSGDVRITAEPFSTRPDAERAESLVIRALADAETSGSALLNIAKMKQSRDLTALLPFQEGVLRYSELSGSLLVKIGLDRIDEDRAVVSGVTKPAEAAERCRQYWGLGACIDQSRPITNLVAITTADAKPARVVGIWETQPVTTWERRAVTLMDPDKGDVGGHVGKGFDWEGYNPQSLGYSRDIRALSS